jgi:hypothetical protein
VIPRDYITEWRSQVPWVEDVQVEQDLVICRALVNIYTHPVLSRTLAFRGGTPVRAVRGTSAKFVQRQLIAMTTGESYYEAVKKAGSARCQ